MVGGVCGGGHEGGRSRARARRAGHAPFPTRNQLITIETAIAHGGREAVSRRHALRWRWCGGGHGAWAAAAARVLAGPATTPWPTQHQRNNNRELTQRRMQRARESGISYRPLAKRTGLLKNHGTGHLDEKKRPFRPPAERPLRTKSGLRTHDERRQTASPVEEHRTKMDCEEGTPKPKKSGLREGGGRAFTKLF